MRYAGGFDESGASATIRSLRGGVSVFARWGKRTSGCEESVI